MRTRKPWTTAKAKIGPIELQKEAVAADAEEDNKESPELEARKKTTLYATVAALKATRLQIVTTEMRYAVHAVRKATKSTIGSVRKARKETKLPPELEKSQKQRALKKAKMTQALKTA